MSPRLMTAQWIYTAEAASDPDELGNFQLTLEAPYFLGDGSKADSGEVAIEGLYNVNTEGLALPAFAVAGGFSKPYGQDGPDGGPESELSILATKSLWTPEVSGDSPLAYVPRQLHLNATWFHNFDPLPDEREDRYLVGIGYSQPVTNNLVLVTDIFRETDREDGKANNIAEVGARYVLTPQTILSAGAGSASAATGRRTSASSSASSTR